MIFNILKSFANKQKDWKLIVLFFTESNV